MSITRTEFDNLQKADILEFRFQTSYKMGSFYKFGLNLFTPTPPELTDVCECLLNDNVTIWAVHYESIRRHEKIKYAIFLSHYDSQEDKIRCDFPSTSHLCIGGSVRREEIKGLLITREAIEFYEINIIDPVKLFTLEIFCKECLVNMVCNKGLHKWQCCSSELSGY